MVTFVQEFTEQTELPVVVGLVNQRRLREHAFETQLVAEKPDDTAAGGNRWILINTAAKADNAKDLVFLDREAHKNPPRYIKRIAGDAVLKIHAWFELDTGAGMVFHNVFECQMPIQSLQMIGQAIVRVSEIKPFIFDSGAKVPFPGDEKPMVVAKIV